MQKDIFEPKECKNDHKHAKEYYDSVQPVVKSLISSTEKENSFDHVGYLSMPSHEIMIQNIHQARLILFPGYFTQSRLDRSNLEYWLGQKVTSLFDSLSRQVMLSIQHECLRSDLPCSKCFQRGRETAKAFIEMLPELREILATDTRAAMEGDPAAKAFDEIIFSYPGLMAITVYRMAHILFNLDVPIIPRMMTEYAHSQTGIDIHPGAKIGKSFFIDHGTGVVVGETTEIGNQVRIYQGVTLGALSLPRDAGSLYKNKKRHPTIEDDVIIYSNATILGGKTTIGARSVIGGNVWITESVPPDTKVLMKQPELIYTGKNFR